MSDDTSRPSLWRPFPVESLQDPSSKAVDHVSHQRYHEAREDLVTPWQIIGDGQAARARIFIRDGVAKLKDPHYRFSVGELFDVLPEATLERADDGKGNCYLSLPRGEYELSIRPLTEMYSMLLEQPDDMFLQVTSTPSEPPYWDNDSSELSFLRDNGPLEIQEAYHRAQLEIRGGDWTPPPRGSASDNYRLFFPGGAQDMHDPAFVHGVRSVLGQMKEGMHYYWQREGKDLMLCVPELHFDHFVRPQLLRPLEEYLGSGTLPDSLGSLQAPVHEKARPVTPVIDLMERRAEKLVLGASLSQWEVDTSDDIRTRRITLTRITQPDALKEAVARFMADRYPSSGASDSYLYVGGSGNSLIIDIDAERFTQLEQDAKAYQARERTRS